MILLKLLQQYDGYDEWNNAVPNQWPVDERQEQSPYPPPPPQRPTYGLSNRLDIPPSPPPNTRGLNFAVYDPVTRQRTTPIDRNCTAPGCCVPKCFAEKGNRVICF